jgi:hypothetical protein
MRRALASAVVWLAAACPVAVAHADPRSAYELAEARAGVADFEAAASLFEASARANCRSDAWERAVHLRVALGEPLLASADADRFARSCGGMEAARVARMHLQLAEGHAGGGRWRAAAGAAAAAVRWADRARSTPLRAAAQVRLGAALRQANDRSGATAALARAVADATRGGASQADPDGGAERREALAEARFRLAESIRHAQQRVVLPSYRGDRSEDSVFGYVTRVLPQLRRQWTDAVKAEAAFLRVFGVEATTRRCSVPRGWFDPLPPDAVDCSEGLDGSERLVLSQDPLADTWTGTPPSARWAVASAREIGAIWVEVYDTWASLPSIKCDSRYCWDCRGCGGPSVPEVVDRRAIVAFKACLHFSRAFEIVDEVEACSRSEWQFDRVEAKERIDELFPQIGYMRRFEAMPVALPFPASSAAPPSL